MRWPIAGPLPCMGDTPENKRDSPDMTSKQAKGTKARASRKRLAALGTAGLLAIGLGSNLLSAGAQVAAPVAGETVAAPPSTVVADAAPGAVAPVDAAPPATPSSPAAQS